MQIFRIAASALLVLLLGLLAAFLAWGRNLPSVSDLAVLELAGKSAVYDRSGTLVGTLDPALNAGQRLNRDLLKLNQISPYLRDAVVTSEDRRFYQHGAVDPIGLVRGLFRSVSGDTQGGSTITQQVVKNTLLSDIKDERTIGRKFREALLAIQVERRFSKQEILTAYLNVVYWGAGRGDLIGAGSAARAYFRRDAANLNLAQSAYLATLLPNPRRYFDFQGYRPLMKDLLSRMVEDGRITQAQADAAWRYPLEPAGWRVRYDGQGNVRSAELVDRDAKRRNTPAQIVRFGDGYLDEVDRQAAALIGRSALYKGNVRVYTYLDHATQAAAEQASRDAQVPDGATLGMAFLDPRSGEVLALVGQKLGDGVMEEWNNATRARRQVGSSIKPLLYTTALSDGWQQTDTVLDVPLDGDYQPKNYDGSWTGRPVSLRYALDHSLNLPTVRLAQQVGLSKFESKLSDLGLEVPDNAGLSLAIGTLQASPLQMAAAYAPFANAGQYRAPRLIQKIVGPQGEVLYQDPVPAPKQVWDAQTAWLGLDMIRGVVNDLTPREGGLGWRARISGWEVGGKTGTTNDVKDLWFVGVTPVLSGAVWVGRADGGALPQNAYSGDVAAPIWQQAAAGALQGRQVADFQEPGGIAYATVRGIRMAFKPDSGGFFGRFFGGGQRSAPPAPDPAPSPDQLAPADSPVTPDQTPGDQLPSDPSAGNQTPSDQPPTDQTPADPYAQPVTPDPSPAPSDQSPPDQTPTAPGAQFDTPPGPAPIDQTPVDPYAQPAPSDGTSQDQGGTLAPPPDQGPSGYGGQGGIVLTPTPPDGAGGSTFPPGQ